MGPVEQLLREAWLVIEDPSKRCKMYYAIDSCKDPIEAESKEACQWCSIGALQKADHNKTIGEFWQYTSAYNLLIQAAKNLGCPAGVGRFNDTDLISNPPKLYTEAIRLAEEAGA